MRTAAWEKRVRVVRQTDPPINGQKTCASFVMSVAVLSRLRTLFVDAFFGAIPWTRPGGPHGELDVGLVVRR